MARILTTPELRQALRDRALHHAHSVLKAQIEDDTGAKSYTDHRISIERAWYEGYIAALRDSNKSPKKP